MPSRRLALLLAVACAGHTGPEPCTAVSAPADTRVLVFTRTTGFRHSSIDTAVRTIRALGLTHGWATDHGEDPGVFTDAGLSPYDAVIFANTTGDVLDASQEASLQRFVLDGGGFVGIHSAADTEHGWAWYGELVGARFASHPAIQPATVKVVDATHASTRCLPPAFSRTDEWYNFAASPAATVLLTLDESSYQGGTMGAAHPAAWAKRLGSGRSWYTVMGHTEGAYDEAIFQRLIVGGIVWAASR